MGRLPYETLVVPLAEPALPDALRLLPELVARLRRFEGAAPWNAWLHHGDAWHFELVPRFSVLAGLELGAGVYVNSLPPEQAADNLRAG